MDRFTTVAQEALATAQRDAVGRGNPEVTGLHLLRALVEEPNSAPANVLAKAGVNAARVLQVTEAEMSRLPKVSNGAGNGGRELVEILAKAEQEAKKPTPSS